MPAPRKKPNKKEKPPSPELKKSTNTEKIQISVAVPALSSMDPTMTSQVISEIRNTVLNSINDAELQRALDKWVKDNHSDVKIAERDYHLLKSVITEYLDSFILFGYTPSGERIIVQHAATARDQDAVMEFLKMVFVQHQQSNFLSIDNEDEE